MYVYLLNSHSHTHKSPLTYYRNRHTLIQSQCIPVLFCPPWSRVQTVQVESQGLELEVPLDLVCNIAKYPPTGTCDLSVNHVDEAMSSQNIFCQIHMTFFSCLHIAQSCCFYVYMLSNYKSPKFFFYVLLLLINGLILLNQNVQPPCM